MFKGKLLVMLTIGLLWLVSFATAQSPDGFYPLALGNYWEYEEWEVPPHGGPWISSHRVVGDTVMSNGLRYWVIHRRSHDWGWETYAFERVSPDFELFVYWPNHGYPNDEVLKYKLDPQPGEVWFFPYEHFPGCCYLWLDSLSQRTLFDTVWTVMELSFADTSLNPWGAVLLFNGLGPYNDVEINCTGYAFLRGAVIDGVQYGRVTSIEPQRDAEVPTGFGLAQNFPNPFNAATVIPYHLPTQRSAVSGQPSVPITLTVYDILGRAVRTLVDEPQLPGAHEVIWDGRDDGGQAVATGMYLYRLQAGGYEVARRLALLR